MRRWLIPCFTTVALLAVIVSVPWFLLPSTVRAQVNTFCAANVVCNVTAAWNFKIFENTQFVDSTLSRGGSDIGAEINLAYAALPANGGDIWIFPNGTNSAYSFSTPIVLATANKIARLRGHAPSTPTPTQGLTLNYTPTTATTAITLDYDNGASGGGQNSHIAIESITLMNNNCVTLGGCGSSATGIAIGNTNGAQSAVFKDMRVSGFGTGISNPNNNSWGQTLENVGFTYNTTGLNYVSAENTTLTGAKFVANGTAITTVGGELTMLGGSLDSSVTAGFVCTGGAGQQINYLIGVHMENQNGQASAGANLSSHFFTGTCNMTILGGAMENDNRSAGGTSDWLLNSSGGALVVEGTEFSSVFSGALTTGYLNLVSPVRAKVSFIDSAPTVANPSCGGSGCAAANINRIVQGTNNNASLWQLGDTVFNTTVGMGDAFFTPNTSVGLHIRTANSLDAIRTEDRTDNEVMDFGPGICGTTFFTFEDITNAVCALEYQFTTKQWIIPATVSGGLTVNPVASFPGNTAALTADWTCGTGGTVASCVAATIIGSGGGVPLTFTLPMVAKSYTLECDGVVGQATAATLNQWNLLTATNGATNVTANYSMATAATAYAAGAVTDQASTTTTFQIAPSWTLGGTGTKMPFHIWAKVEGASASGTVLSLQLLAPTVGDLVTIYRGTACRIF